MMKKNIVFLLLVSGLALFYFLWTARSSSPKGEMYNFEFLANSEAEDPFSARTELDVTYSLTIDTGRMPDISLDNFSKLKYWKNGGIVLEISHKGTTIKLNDAIRNTSFALNLPGNHRTQSFGMINLDSGFIDIFPAIDGFLDVDIHPDSSLVDFTDLTHDAFIYGRLDVYDDQQQFLDLYDIAANGNVFKLSKYVVQAH